MPRTAPTAPGNRRAGAAADAARTAKPVALRAAGPRDADTVAALLRQFATEIGASATFSTADWVRAGDSARKRARAHPRCHTVIAERASEGGIGAALGVVIWTPAYDPLAGATGATIAALYVVPAWRRNGIGRRLMAAVARASKAAGGRYVAWATDRNAMAARMFYDGIGAPHPTTIVYSAQGEAFDDLAGDE